MIVMKFGGSSVAGAERIANVAEIIKSKIKHKPILVLSAMGDTTDLLLEAADTALKKGIVSIEKIEEFHLNTINDLSVGSVLQKEVKSLFWDLGSLLTGISLTRELTGRTKDCLVSFGERLSVRIAAAYFCSKKINARALDAWDAGFVSDSSFGQAELRRETYIRIASSLRTLIAEGILPVVTGFIAKDENGNITTLGRGGSDLSATVIAAACKAEEVQIWKDVDGILSADPRLVKDPRPVELVSYDEAAELAYFGAQVLHPRAMQPCIQTGIPVLVKNSFNPEAAGTRIETGPVKGHSLIRAITSKKNVTLVDIVSTRMLGQSGFLARVFAEFAKVGISIDMIATSEVSVSLTLDSDKDLSTVCKELAGYAGVEVKTGKAIVTIIGDIRRSSEILHEAFGICCKLGFQVQMISQGASKVNISFIVNDNEADSTVKELHSFFFTKPAIKENAKAGPVKKPAASSKETKVKIALIGYGKMGKMIEAAVCARGHQITAVIDPFAHNIQSAASAALLSTIPPKAEDAGSPDVFIEFTMPKSAPDNITAAAALGKPVVCGTTGWYEKLPEVSAMVEKAGMALLWSSNFSLGVNLFYRIVQYAAQLADPFDEYDVGGTETHHRKKADSPSGTAKTMMEHVLSAMKRKTKVLWGDLPAADPSCGGALPQDAIHFSSLRYGTVPGTHSLFFDSPADTIEITHTARSREGFASGAVIAAEWLCGSDAGKPAGKTKRGIFTMDDVLKDTLPK